MNTRQRRTSTASKTELHDAPTLEPAALQAQNPNFGHQFGQISVYPNLEQSGLEQAGSQQSSFERGPFSSDINRVLATAFNQPLEGLSVMRGAGDFNQAINARASAIGRNIYLNADIEESLSSPEGMEIIAHEVAHALRPSHGTKLLSQTSDSSEHAAHDAGRAVRGGLERGAIERGSARAAPSGEAVVQRWEGFEHKRAVDDVFDHLDKDGKPVKGNLVLPEGEQVNPAVQDLMQGKVGADGKRDSRITLANGVKVTPGEITALMGDLYGRFDDKTGQLDPAASFAQLTNADPKEMNKLLGLLAREDAGEKIEASDWEGATRNRRDKKDGKDVNGEKQTGLSYLELAERNNSHFSKAENTGTDNNLGTYAAFHKMALEAAAKGDMETAKALEASSMHYLTDRHAGGHNFNKSDVMDASGRDSGGILANMAVKTAHDNYNEHGTQVANADGDPKWLAKGDGHWEDDDNKDNKRQTAKSVYTSWNELNQAATGVQSPDSLEKAGYSAFGTVPQFDQQRQEGAEGMARNTTMPDMLLNYGKDLPDAILGKVERAFGKHIENPVSDAWDWGKEKAGDAWDWTKDKAGQAANWIGDTASGAWDWTQEKAGQAVDWAGEKAGDAWDWTKQTANDAGDWVGDKAQGAWNAAGDAANWAGNKAGQAANWAGDKASNAVDWAGDKASSAVNYVQDNFTLDPREMEFRPWKW